MLQTYIQFIGLLLFVWPSLMLSSSMLTFVVQER